MLAKGHRRDSCIIAIGGGVVTDLAGFVAGTFGSDSKGDYVELKFNKAFELTSASEKVSIEMGLWNNDWSEMKDFEEKDMTIMYDGKLLK